MLFMWCNFHNGYGLFKWSTVHVCLYLRYKFHAVEGCNKFHSTIVKMCVADRDIYEFRWYKYTKCDTELANNNYFLHECETICFLGNLNIQNGLLRHCYKSVRRHFYNKIVSIRVKFFLDK